MLKELKVKIDNKNNLSDKAEKLNSIENQDLSVTLPLYSFNAVKISGRENIKINSDLDLAEEQDARNVAEYD